MGESGLDDMYQESTRQSGQGSMFYGEMWCKKKSYIVGRKDTSDVV